MNPAHKPPKEIKVNWAKWNRDLRIQWWKCLFGFHLSEKFYGECSTFGIEVDWCRDCGHVDVLIEQHGRLKLKRPKMVINKYRYGGIGENRINRILPLQITGVRESYWYNRLCIESTR